MSTRVISKQQSATGKVQGDGAQSFDLADYTNYLYHQIQFTPTTAPSTGTGTVAIKTPGASAYVDIGTMDLTDSTDWCMQFQGLAESIRFTPSTLAFAVVTANSYALYVVSANPFKT